ncbi:hypothetical protein P0136_02585 [Lentisphaerota bacterium ZTH]|nr:hypothetical protein JYG24_06275 [Lentisphaerota bacterium]WET06888.1 hypothetical protein P0136_02585 [Lentisphaerota bacterium ZTH]
MRRALTAVFMFLCFSLFGEAVDAVVFLKAHCDRLDVKLLGADLQGNLSIQEKNGASVISADSYRFVRLTQKPALFIKAEELLKKNDNAAAGKLVTPLLTGYNFHNAEARARVLAARIKLEAKQLTAALNCLKPLLDKPAADPENENFFYAEAFLMMADIYRTRKSLNEAMPLYRRCAELGVPEFSAQANLILGRNALGQKNYDDALRYLMRNVFLYKHGTPARRESLKCVVDIMAKNRDERLKTFKNMLAREYPEVQ